MQVMVLESIESSKERGLSNAPQLLLFSLLLLSGALFAKSDSIVATGNRLGQLGVCGCPVDPKGGLDRLAEWASKEKDTSTLWVDSGQNLFPFESLNRDLAETWKRNAQFMAPVYRQMGVRVMLAGPKDLSGGMAFLETWAEAAGVELVAANLKSATGEKGAFWKSWVEQKNGDRRWAVTGILPMEASLAEGQVSDANTALRTVFQEIRSKAIQSIIVLSALDAKANRVLAQEFKPNFIVGSSDDVLDAPTQVGQTWILQNRREAQSVFSTSPAPSEIFLTSQWNPKTKAAKSVQLGLRQLAAFKQKAAVQAEPKLTVEKKANSKHLPYVANPYLCKNCHLAQYQFWEKTKHSSAYLVLYAKNQHFDPECIGCHSVGFQERGGFSRIADPLLLKGAPERKSGEKPFLETLLEAVFVEDQKKPLDSRVEPERFHKLKARYHEALDQTAAKSGFEHVYIGVQCENCHGNRYEHFHQKVKKASKKPVAATTCTQCHNSLRDPEFSFVKALPQVACPVIPR